MNTGMLWMNTAGSKEIESVVKSAMEFYELNYGTKPTKVFVSPKAYEKLQEYMKHHKGELNGLEVAPFAGLTGNQVWLGASPPTQDDLSKLFSRR